MVSNVSQNRSISLSTLAVRRQTFFSYIHIRRTPHFFFFPLKTRIATSTSRLDVIRVTIWLNTRINTHNSPECLNENSKQLKSVQQRNSKHIYAYIAAYYMNWYYTTNNTSENAYVSITLQGEGLKRINNP